MNKNLSVINQNNKLMLKKSKSLMSITNNILSSDDWMQRLWAWADENNIPDYGLYGSNYDYDDDKTLGIPRNKNNLINLTDLFLHPVFFPGYSEVYEYKIKLPQEVGNLIEVTEISILSYEEITLPKEVGSLINLQTLQLMSYEFLKLPQEIGSLSNLTFLDLECYKFLDIPKEIGKLNTLKILYLESEGLLTIPREIGQLTGLDTLRIICSDVLKLPKEIISLTNLTNLKLHSYNKLILTAKQKAWIHELIENGCNVDIDDDLLERQTGYEVVKGK